MSQLPPSLTVPIIGYHQSALSQKFGIPRQPNLVDLPSVIELIAPYNLADAVDGLQTFSHLWITWQAHHNHANHTTHPQQQPTFKPKVRPPRLGGNTKIGVFATRSTYRPAALGLSVVELINIETSSNSVRLHISGADMIDGTPIIDIKPYIAYSDAIANANSGFAKQAPLQKTVIINEQANQQLQQLISNGSLSAADIDYIQQLIAQDPRPAYRQTVSTRIYTMRYQNIDIGFRMEDIDILRIIAVTVQNL